MPSPAVRQPQYQNVYPLPKIYLFSKEYSVFKIISANYVKSIFPLEDYSSTKLISVVQPISSLEDYSPAEDISDIKPISPLEDHSSDEVLYHLLGIKKRIEESKNILSYKYNWDENGALPVNPIIYKRATHFLEAYSDRIYDVCKKILIAPDIVPVSDGSIDLEWNLEDSSFLINFKNGIEEIAFYYGEFKDSDNVTFDTNGQIHTNTVNDKFASYLSYLSKEENL